MVYVPIYVKHIPIKWMYVCQLLEKRVILRVREEDISLAEEIVGSASQRYEDEVGMQVKVKYTRVWCMHACQLLEKRVVVRVCENILLSEELYEDEVVLKVKFTSLTDLVYIQYFKFYDFTDLVIPPSASIYSFPPPQKNLKFPNY